MRVVGLGSALEELQVDADTIASHWALAGAAPLLWDEQNAEEREKFFLNFQLLWVRRVLDLKKETKENPPGDNASACFRKR